MPMLTLVRKLQARRFFQPPHCSVFRRATSPARLADAPTMTHQLLQRFRAAPGAVCTAADG